MTPDEALETLRKEGYASPMLDEIWLTIAQEIERLRAEREELWVEAWVAARLPDSGLSPLAYQRARGEVEAEARRRWKERKTKS